MSMKSRNLPIEWMGPATWRLPSGQALAEFALQAGFLAPLLLGDRALLRGASKTASEPQPVELKQQPKLTKVSR